MLFKNGELAATKVGAMSKAQLTAFIDQQLANMTPTLAALRSLACVERPVLWHTLLQCKGCSFSCHNRQLITDSPLHGSGSSSRSELVHLASPLTSPKLF
jgi:hypothetical protein